MHTCTHTDIHTYIHIYIPHVCSLVGVGEMFGCSFKFLRWFCGHPSQKPRYNRFVDNPGEQSKEGQYEQQMHNELGGRQPPSAERKVLLRVVIQRPNHWFWPNNNAMQCEQAGRYRYQCTTKYQKSPTIKIIHRGNSQYQYCDRNKWNALDALEQLRSLWQRFDLGRSLLLIPLRLFCHNFLPARYTTGTTTTTTVKTMPN